MTGRDNASDKDNGIEPRTEMHVSLYRVASSNSDAVREVFSSPKAYDGLGPLLNK